MPFLLPVFLAASVSLALLAHFAGDRRMLRRYVGSVVRPGHADRRSAALRLGGVIHNQVRRLPDDPYFLLPVLGPLGATPAAVIRKGGCCSGMSRLYITALHQLGVPAAQVTVYHAAGHAQHCLVEVDLEASG
jgi:hypothetical protein